MLSIGRLDKIHTNPRLYKMLTERDLPDTNESSNSNVAYVDDLSQVIGNLNKIELQVYAQEVFDIKVTYFHSNLLAINNNVYLMTQDGRNYMWKVRHKLIYWVLNLWQKQCEQP